MSKKVLIFHTINHVNQAIGLTVQIRLVYLLNITGKHHFGSFASTGDNSFYFMWSQVLCFINLRPRMKANASITSCSLFCISSKRFTSVELEAN